MQKASNIKTENSAVLDTLLITVVLVFMAWFYYGLRAISVTLVSVIASYLTDILCVKLKREKYDYHDLSAVLSGVLMALMMPATVSYHIVIVANFLAITLGKQIFGGKGKNIFNPTIVGFLLSSLCWKETMLFYPKPNDVIEVFSNDFSSLSVSFTQVLGYASTPSVSFVDIALGKFAGPMGATHVVLLIVCAAVLIFRRSASGLTFGSAAAVIGVMAYFYPVFGTTRLTSVVYELSSGMVLFALLFLACDPYTIPKTKSSRFIFGAVTGLLTVLFLRVGKAENAVLYAILIAQPVGISVDASAFSFLELWEEFKLKMHIKKRNKQSVTQAENTED